MSLKPMRVVHLILFAVVIIIIGCAVSTPLPNHRSADGYRGKVKSVKVETWIVRDESLGVFDVEFGIISESLEIEQTPVLKRYDKYGRGLEVILYDFENKPYKRLILSYDNNGYLKEVISYDRDGKVFYNEKRKVDANGRVTEVSIDDRNKGSQSFITYTYDSHGNRMEEVVYSKDMLPVSKTVLHYDEKGLLKEKQHYDSYIDGKWEENTPVVIYKYDSANRLIAVKDFDTNSSSYLMLYEYDSAGNRIKLETFNHQGLRIQTKLKTYNKHGDVTMSQEPSQYFEYPVYGYTYKYDEQGNWVECLISVDDSLKYWVTRRIEYYED